MENVIEFTSGEIPEKGSDKSKVEITEIIVDGEVIDTAPESGEIPKAYTRVRSPELRKRAEKLLMTGISLLGTGAGTLAAVLGAFGESPSALLSEKLSSGFLSVFGSRLIINCGGLAVQFLLGFFAFGDWLAWTVPLFLGLGLGLTLASCWHAALLPSAAAVIICGSLGAAFGSGFSATLRSFANGDKPRTEDFPAGAYTAKFLLLLGVMVLAAIYDGIISEFVFK